MTGNHWLRVTALTAAVAAAVPASRAFAQPAAPAPPSAALTAQGEINDLQRTLFDGGRNGGRDPRERDEAAKRLLQRNAYGVLLQGLRSDKRDVQVAVARALADQENPPELFLNDLMTRCLDTSVSAELAEAAAQAIANYRDNPAARAKLRDFINSGNVSEGVRLLAIKALGTLNDKETAEFLVQTLRRGETQRISDAAADALVEMTGRADFGHDLGQWDAWWRDQQDRPPAQFLNDRRVERERRFGQASAGLRGLASNFERLMSEMHSKAKDDAERESLVYRLLTDTTPEFRATGARLVQQERAEGLTVRQKVKDRLRELIGDSSPDVRQKVADAIRSINDPAASKALLAQLRNESIPSVRAALLAAIGPTKDVSAVPDLIRLLDDPSFQVSEAAARALADMGSEIAKNPDLERPVASALARTILQTEKRPGSNRLRENVVQAMLPLKDPTLVKPLLSLLDNRGESTTNLRRSAVLALGAMSATPLRNEIAQRLADVLAREVEPSVRLEAATALGMVGGPAQAEALYARMDRNKEPDKAVRAEAAKSLTSLFPEFPVADLMNWAQVRFNGMPEMQVTVYTILNNKLIPAGASDDLAYVQEQLGTLYLDKLGKPDEAIPYLRQALDYWDGKPNSRTEGLQESLMTAHLQAKHYKEAVQFAGERIARIKEPANPNKGSMGRAIVVEVNRLVAAKQFDSALELLKEARDLDVGTFFRQQIEEKDREVRGKIPAFQEWFFRYWSEVVA